jgi:hypothetical protein
MQFRYGYYLKWIRKDLMIDLGQITFTQSYEDGNTITHTIRGDSSLDEVVEAFEYFLKGAGYHLGDGCHIGYEYDDEKEEKHSVHYYDFDRNRDITSSSTSDIVSLVVPEFGQDNDDDGTRN